MAEKFQNPSSKLQRNTKLQTSNQFSSAADLKLEIWGFSGA
jgi:hypothetical protein